ncbi:PEP-CTERM sorting domain-containing protein [Rubellicoccus peritrichatus]|uniref:PEP-CTERM sorting domain-containing protein n=1 Tax=Rubellicoccus peritrichatus TaxID=3080537 RepID=A0AAQ3LFH3_9BACT|nr:PEP-CTERM sorting domain-containing protein [Puniceicoccus sp. CR14]WOO42793.1 PEP-CTERM sorting domain-containing protein [Puniceicoccus sp. CR14]
MQRTLSRHTIQAITLHGVILVLAGISNLHAIITYPTALTVGDGISQDWGSSSFSSMPSGYIAGKQPTFTSSNIAAAASAVLSTNIDPIASTSAGSIGNGSQPGPFGYATGGDAQFVLTPRNASSNGTHALLMAIDTTGIIDDLRLSYDLEAIVADSSRRGAGIVTQYRIGQTGGWTTLNDSYFISKSAPPPVGTVEHFSIALPAEVLNQSEVQLRWVGYYEPVTGLYTAIGIDNISVAVPEPATYALLLAGIATITVVFRKSRKVASSKPPA